LRRDASNPKPDDRHIHCRSTTQAEAEGLDPTKEWVKDLVDEIIAEEFASPDLELAWLDEDEGDPKGLEAVLEGRVKLGAVTLNEMRDALGLDPFATAAADRPMVLTATGYVPIEANASGEGAPADASNASGSEAEKFAFEGGSMLAGPAGELSSALRKHGYDPEEPRVPKHNAGGGRWTKDGASAAARIAEASEKPASSLPGQVLSHATPGVHVAAGIGQPGYPIDLVEEEKRGGHAIERHVGKSEAYLLASVRKAAEDAQRNGFAEGLRVGSFSSLEAANKLVNSTVSKNQAKVDW
jgi:hypothetical protein